MTVARSGRRASSAGGVVSARYWRLRPPSDSTGHNWNQVGGAVSVWATTMYELQMFASSDATGTDLTTGKTASAPDDGVNPASFLIDDNLLTRWSTMSLIATPAAITLDFGTPVSIGSLTLLPFDGVSGIHPKNYIWEYSGDDISYTTITTIPIPDVITLITITDL